jgi:hypothetical protein
MDTDQWIKIFPILTTLGFGGSTLWLSIKQYLDGNKNARREEYKFAKIFFDDLKANPDMHSFARKKGFQAVGRSQDLPPAVIEHLMMFHDPVTALEDYEISRGYLQKNEGTGQLKLSFARIFLWSTEKRRKLLSAIYLICMVLFYFLAFTPWLLLTMGKISVPIAINLTIASMPIGIAVAIIAAREFIQLRRAIRLIHAQSQLEIDDAPWT